MLRDDLGESHHSILVAPAQDISTNVVNSFLSLTGALLFVAVGPERVERLNLQPMQRPQPRPPSQVQPSVTIEMCLSVEARHNVTTGISVADRTATIRALGAVEPTPQLLVNPGHVIPVRTKPGGVLTKNALPEGACDLVRLAGFVDAALYIDLLNTEGEHLNSRGQISFAQEHDLEVVRLSEVVQHRLEQERIVERITEAKLPTRAAGEMRVILYRSPIHEGDHIALVKGEIDPESPTLTRVQPEFTLTDVFGGGPSQSRKLLHSAMRAIDERGSGVVLYLKRPDTTRTAEHPEIWNQSTHAKPSAMLREYGLGAQILADLGVQKIEMLTTSNRKMVGLKAYGVEVVAQRTLEAHSV